MKHPTDDILLAYIRNQQGQWRSGTKDHLTTCIVCSRRCAELKHTGYAIEDWAHSYQNDAAYATVSNRVLRTLHTAKPARAIRPKIRVSVGVVLASLCLILLVGFTANLTGSFASPFKWNSLPSLPSHMTTNTPQPPTSGAATKPAIVTSCTKDVDVKEQHLHVCGSNFTPDSVVMVVYKLADGKIKKHDAQVAKNGTFIDTLRINSCNDIPTTIDATNTKNNGEAVHFNQYIVFGNC